MTRDQTVVGGVDTDPQVQLVAPVPVVGPAATVS